jgi:hypothetical protein
MLVYFTIDRGNGLPLRDRSLSDSGIAERLRRLLAVEWAMERTGRSGSAGTCRFLLTGRCVGRPIVVGLHQPQSVSTGPLFS